MLTVEVDITHDLDTQLPFFYYNYLFFDVLILFFDFHPYVLFQPL